MYGVTRVSIKQVTQHHSMLHCPCIIVRVGSNAKSKTQWKSTHIPTQSCIRAQMCQRSLTALCRSCLLEALLPSCSNRRPKAEAIADTVSATPLTAAPAVSAALPLLAAPVMPLTAEVSVRAIKLTSVKVLFATCDWLLLPRVLIEEASDGTSTRNTSEIDCTSTSRSRLTQFAASAG